MSSFAKSPTRKRTKRKTTETRKENDDDDDDDRRRLLGVSVELRRRQTAVEENQIGLTSATLDRRE